MDVTLNPVVSFKSDTNLIAVKVNQAQKPVAPVLDSKPISEQQMQANLENLKQALKDGQAPESMIKSDYWEKIYNPATNSVHAKIPGAYDGLEYEIYSDGKVVTTDGWGRNQVEKEKDAKLAEYVSAMKKDFENASADKFEKNVAQNLSEVELLQKKNAFNESLKSRKWKKEYLAENNIIMIRQRNVKDGVEYMVKNDGTVLETGKNIEHANVIVEPSSESAKVFSKLKGKLDPNAPKKSLWTKGKEVVANIWKFFTVTGTMAVATAKGLAQGAVAGAAVLAGAFVVKGSLAMIKNQKTIGEIFKTPLKTAGVAGKSLAVVAGLAVLAGHLIAGKMNANQKSAVIEHKIDVEHVNN